MLRCAAVHIIYSLLGPPWGSLGIGSSPFPIPYLSVLITHLPPSGWDSYPRVANYNTLPHLNHDSFRNGQGG